MPMHGITTVEINVVGMMRCIVDARSATRRKYSDVQYGYALTLFCGEDYVACCLGLVTTLAICGITFRQA